VLSSVPQGSVLGPLFLNIFIYYWCNIVNYSRHLLFAGIKIFSAIKSPNDCYYNLTDSVQGWCNASFIKLNISKTNVISFSQKNILIYNYIIYQSPLIHTNPTKWLVVFTDTKFQFHNHADNIFSQCIKLLGLVCTLTFSFSSFYCLYMLHFTLVRSKFDMPLLFEILLQLLMPTNQKTSSRSLQPFVIIVSFPCPLQLCQNLVSLELHALHKRRHHLDALFSIQVYLGTVLFLCSISALQLKIVLLPD
jgi:hypothetical protein